MVSVFEESLENDIRSYSELLLIHFVYTGDFEKLMVSLATAKRDETSEVNATIALFEAENLYKQGTYHFWINKSGFWN